MADNLQQGVYTMLRRDFLQQSTAALTAAAGGMMSLAFPGDADAVATGGGIDIGEGVWMLDEGKEKNLMPRIRREILSNPRAVFIIETDVAGSPDEQGFFTDQASEILGWGNRCASYLFEKGHTKGGATFIKTNYTWIPPNSYNPVFGGITSSHFAAGFTGKLRDMGNTNVMVGDRGGTNIRNHRQTGIYDVMDAHDINVMMPTYRHFRDYEKNELNWHNVKEPVIWKKIPTYRPLGDKDTIFINMAKLKCHYLTGTTLSIKNLQGAIPTGYGHFCNLWAELDFLIDNVYEIDHGHFTKHWQERTEEEFRKHRAAGFKHWDYEGSFKKYEQDGGWDNYRKIRKDREAVKVFRDEHPYLLRDELWIQRALDAASSIRPTLNVVEGVVGRDGDGFSIGRDELTNVVLAGMSTFEVDVIGSWIMGHDPRELWYTRVANERGLAECDPAKIDVYRITANGIEPVRNIEDLPRYRLGCNLHAMLKETGMRKFW